MCGGGGALVSDGSSPLARGLLGNRLAGGEVGRIIPARAGFTPPLGDPPGPLRDHPRSRGVYLRLICAGHEISGSSPLARGLPPEADALIPDEGIIPARAGFTPRTAVRMRWTRDHPRSRGVYGLSYPHTPSAAGSSPLARGLLVVESAGVAAGRIIPARAGFTAQCRPIDCKPTDHPRSRGVYASSEPWPRMRAGSSPLARGLLPLRGLPPESSGIIPARAGFTPTRWRRGSRGWDHPRSRGVYGLIYAWNNSETGSSPLARGLQGPPLLDTRRARIIPARAGFT